MTFKRFCTQCGKQFQPKGKFGFKCDKCIKINFIKFHFKKNKQFKGITTLKEALHQYG